MIKGWIMPRDISEFTDQVRAVTIVPELLTPAQTARLLSIGQRTLWRHSRSGAAPAPRKIGGAVRYSRSEILEWIAAGCPRIDGRA